MKRKKRKKDRSTQYGHGKIVLMPSGYPSDLHKLVDDIYDTAHKEKWSYVELANRAHLSYVTVWKLGNRITRFPRFDTIWKLARATGFSLQLLQKRKGASRQIRFKRANG